MVKLWFIKVDKMSNSEEEKYKISRDNIDRPELIKLIYKPKFLLAVVLIYAGLGIPFYWSHNTI